MMGTGSNLTFEKKKKTLKNYGHWTGVRGNSRFYSDKESVKKMGAEYVKYINGETDFSRFSICTKEIPPMTNDRFSFLIYYKSNFEQAYPEIAKILKIKGNQVRKWLKNNNILSTNRQT